jgi:hypothetical protein
VSYRFAVALTPDDRHEKHTHILPLGNGLALLSRQRHSLDILSEEILAYRSTVVITSDRDKLQASMSRLSWNVNTQLGFNAPPADRH